MQHAIDGIGALLRGERPDLNDVAIDTEDLPDFNRKVYDITRAIPPGATLTYGEIAERLGDKLLARDVGQALGQNPIPLIVPCHRVLAAGGKIRRIFRQRRRGHKAAAADNRRRAAKRTDPVRPSAFGCEAPPALLAPASTWPLP